jgi:hypothetical protein
VVPVPIDVTAEVGEVGDAMVAVPLATDQRPVPIIGEFPFRFILGLFAQRVWLLPAIAVVGI